MYLWMILATFLATLAAYMLPLREDLHKALDEPVAETVLMKMKIKHYTVQKMMRALTNDDDSVQFQATDNPDEFKNDIEEDIDIADYKPFEGFNLSDDYHSVIKCFCYTPGAEGAEGTYTLTSNNNCCHHACDTIGGDVKRGLLTYGPVPKQWLMETPNGWTPSADLLAAFRKNFAGGEKVGTIVLNDDESYSIQTYSAADNEIYSIPEEFNNFVTDCDNENVCFGYLSGI